MSLDLRWIYQNFGPVNTTRPAGFERWVTKDELYVCFISGFSETKAVWAGFHCSTQLNYADDLPLAFYMYVNI